MKRKQIYLTETLEREINSLSKKEDKPKAEVIRELLNVGLEKKKPKEPPGAVLLRIGAKATPGPGDLSTNLSRYLYGDKSPNYGKRITRGR
ncbi:MAG: hypothetical protein A2Z24_02170 [Candidatus Woykebacteria bacterium RBG_16_44_10]|uniref:Ribbon-helix-helix protein CopG domain-containing protein n=1 Tax=Candidatus Woykebacteria bacterium RBG_16_44_10 TaxID=1802597 RepID=A0A1G1WFW9_9BACT|nr:MAG: hypothetical protein A2Z24_02170 [Candidatus Woykebacteria bacterium RBG_16_44_10]